MQFICTEVTTYFLAVRSINATTNKTKVELHSKIKTFKILTTKLSLLLDYKI